MAAKPGYAKLNGKLTEIGDAPRGRGIDGHGATPTRRRSS